MGEWTYEKAGVSIEKAEAFVDYIKEKVQSLPRQALLFGSFASGISLEGYKNPVIMMTTDGVGTKLKIAQEVKVHHTVGIDLVAMNVNDLLTTGAKPIAFLDYIAVGKIDLEVLKRVMDGIVEGCKMADVALVGGETAEMPDFYPEGTYDLAGFCVGVCEREELITGKDIKPRDIIIGFPSSLTPACLLALIIDFAISTSCLCPSATPIQSTLALSTFGNTPSPLYFTFTGFSPLAVS